jgi:uncharacterized protein YndB with AHSA1/START domain
MSTEPIRRSIVVSATPENAFRLFTEGMGGWWPTERFSLASEREGVKVESVVFEPADGGWIYEVGSDGRRGDWGRVVAWDPPDRVLIDWKPNDRPWEQATELEISFEPDGSGTRVTLEHRAWERLGPDAAEGREGYATGWVSVFDERYGAAASAA